MRITVTSVTRWAGSILAILASLSTPAIFAADYPLQPAPVESVKIDGGFWGPRVTTNATVTVPHNQKFVESSGRMAVFDRAAGVLPKDPDAESYLAVAGEAQAAKPNEQGYVCLKRAWRRGEGVELNLPMPVRRVLAHEKVEANRGRVALQRGPLVYCVEAIDNGNLRTDAIVLPDTASLRIERRKDLLGEVVTITATAGVACEPQPGKTAELRPHPIVAIPYYAWANRSEGYMDIWLARTVAAATPVSAPTAGAVAKVSAFVKRPAGELLALNDRRLGPNSWFRPTPRFVVPKESTDEGGQWIQYEWDEAQELSQTAVYWALDQPKKVYWGKRVRGEMLKLPKSWQFLYKDGNAWLPVQTEETCSLKPDQMNQIRFTPVKTNAVRLMITPSDAPCAIQEWSVN